MGGLITHCPVGQPSPTPSPDSNKQPQTCMMTKINNITPLLPIAQCRGDEESKETEDKTESESEPKVEDDIGKSRDGSKTDDETVQREEEAIKLDGLNVAQMKELRDKAEKHAFQAEVSRMMKLIINSLYRNKEVGGKE